MNTSLRIVQQFSQSINLNDVHKSHQFIIQYSGVLSTGLLFIRKALRAHKLLVIQSDVIENYSINMKIIGNNFLN